MPRFLVVCEVLAAAGTQTWAVEAADEDEARARFNRGEGVIVSDDVEVLKLGEPEVELDAGD